MQRLRFIFLAIPFFYFMSGAVAGQAATILAIDLAGNLHSIVTETGRLTPLGSTGIVQPLSLDRAPDGSLYTFTGGRATGVYRVGENGQSSELLISEPGLTGEGGLVFVSNTKAYGTSRGFPGAPVLFEIDLSTMSVMNIGLLVSGDDINGLALRDDGMLIGVDRVLNRLLAINPTNASVSFVANLNDLTVRAAGGFVVTKDGAFYANSSVDGSINELWKIDLYTGAQSLVANFSGIAGISGLALPVPEPSTALLLGIGLLFLGRRRGPASSLLVVVVCLSTITPNVAAAQSRSDVMLEMLGKICSTGLLSDADCVKLITCVQDPASCPSSSQTSGAGGLARSSLVGGGAAMASAPIPRCLDIVSGRWNIEPEIVSIGPTCGLRETQFWSDSCFKCDVR